MESNIKLNISEHTSPVPVNPQQSTASSRGITALSHPQIQGMVEFDLGYVKHPSFGSVYVKSSFPRLKPKYERNHVQNQDIDALTTNLLGWIQKYVPITGKEKYFHEVARTAILFTVYTSLLPELYSIEMDISIKVFWWLWYIDDEIEDSFDKNIPIKLLKLGTDQFTAILKGKYDGDDSKKLDNKFQDVPNYPYFKTMFNALLDLHKTCLINISDYANRVGPMHDGFRRFFGSLIWFSVDRIDKPYSEESFRYFRRIDSVFYGCVELVALLHGINLPEEIAKSPILKRMLDIAEGVWSFTNDLLGMKKEFKNGQRGSLIIFKVLSKNIPLEEAVKQVCKKLETELSDYLLLKAVLLEEFDCEENLVRYLHALDSLIDGHNNTYLQSTRYQSAGLVTLVR